MARESIFLECCDCKTRYYRTSRNTRAQSKIEVKKFCPKCRKRVDHKERKK